MDKVVDETSRECPECRRSWPLDRFNGKHAECFRCRTKGVGVTFGGGRKNFHGIGGNETLREYGQRTVREAAANGIQAVPAWTKTNYAPPSAGRTDGVGV